jgi:hypothetical protein
MRDSNYVTYLELLFREISNESNPPNVRQAAGLNLKNNIKVLFYCIK